MKAKESEINSVKKADEIVESRAHSGPELRGEVLEEMRDEIHVFI